MMTIVISMSMWMMTMMMTVRMTRYLPRRGDARNHGVWSWRESGVAYIPPKQACIGIF